MARAEREALVDTVKAEREKIEQLGRESALLRQEKGELELMKDELVESLDAEVEQRRALDSAVLALKAQFEGQNDNFRTVEAQNSELWAQNAALQESNE